MRMCRRCKRHRHERWVMLREWQTVLLRPKPSTLCTTTSFRGHHRSRRFKLSSRSTGIQTVTQSTARANQTRDMFRDIYLDPCTPFPCRACPSPDKRLAMKYASVRHESHKGFASSLLRPARLPRGSSATRAQDHGVHPFPQVHLCVGVLCTAFESGDPKAPRTGVPNNQVA